MICYCETCHLICEQGFCPSCGNKKLRTPEKSDFCFLTEVATMFSQLFIDSLKEENIPFTAMPAGNGVRSSFALDLGNHRIYVPFEFFEKASELINEISKGFEEEQNRELFQNIDKLHAQARGEKKIKKNLNLAPEDNLIAYCADKILHADKIVDEGRISSSVGNYLFVYKNDDMIILNSETYEILSAKKITKKK